MPEIKKTSYNSEYIEDKEEQIEYCNLVKESVDSGKYFKDALDWYHLRYITPICDRAYLILTILLLFFMIYVVKTMSDSIFPLVVQQPIFTSAKNAYADKDRFSPRIVKLKPRQGEAGFDPRIENFDDSVIKYLLINYVQDREQFDFRKAKIEDVNKKFNRIKNNSNFREYKNFQIFMSKENPSSPIRFFGKNSKRDIKVTSLKFYRRQPKNFAEKIIFFIANTIPTEADVSFAATTTTVDEIGNIKKVNEEFLVKIKYDYQPIFKNDTKSNITFNVNQYVLYRVKR
ncbi:MAG: hypothetical protein EBT63_05790 [Proteobacteria bacterium]|nr:hypothetical protein [Pseudomonadota bacterium]